MFLSKQRTGRVFAILTILFSALPVQANDISTYTDLGRERWRVAPFSLTDQNGNTVTLDDLRGKVWVAQFFFRCCTQGCPQTTAGMMELQNAFAGNNDILLVSFTLDPETDTAEALRQFAADHGADPKQWLFLTGPENAIHTLVKTSFLQTVAKNPAAGPANKIDHTFRLMAVDRDGYIRGFIGDGRDPDQVKGLEERIRSLAGEPFGLRKFLPAFNASLNATCTVLLVLGYLAIRGRRETLHKMCMLSALLVSVLFLASYLFYHLAILGGAPTRFQGEGWLRPFYFGVLVSHTVLAVVVAPLAVFTAYQGLRDRRPRHVRLARWTLPLWLYVSVTGVAVYWMLYRL